METLHMILGGGMTETEWQSLADTFTSYYTSHISNVKFSVVCYHYTDDVHSMIKANYPTNPLILCGHSYGGCAAVQTAALFAAEGRAINHLVLFDPVSTAPNAYLVPNTAGFAIPENVVEAVAFYRGATEPPFSGIITSGSNFQNIHFPNMVGCGTAAHHGDAIWDASCYGFVATALEGKNFNPSPAPLPPLVNTPPVITINPVNIKVKAGSVASFVSAGTGNPPPITLWQVSTDNGKTFSNIPGSTSQTYSFIASLPQNNNMYRAIYNNSHGTVLSKEAILAVT